MGAGGIVPKVVMARSLDKTRLGPEKARLSPPIMFAFRAAHEAGDARKKIELRDESGERVLASRRAKPRAIINESLLRRDVSRDLENLVNAIALESTVDLDEAAYVRKSILNFGIPDFAHRSIDEFSVREVSVEIATALKNFEPRLVSDSIRVARDDTVNAAELKVRFLVRADLSCEPVHVPVEFVAEVEIETGKLLINRL